MSRDASARIQFGLYLPYSQIEILADKYGVDLDNGDFKFDATMPGFHPSLELIPSGNYMYSDKSELDWVLVYKNDNGDHYYNEGATKIKPFALTSMEHATDVISTFCHANNIEFERNDIDYYIMVDYG